MNVYGEWFQLMFSWHNFWRFKVALLELPYISQGLRSILLLHSLKYHLKIDNFLALKAVSHHVSLATWQWLLVCGMSGIVLITIFTFFKITFKIDKLLVLEVVSHHVQLTNTTMIVTSEISHLIPIWTNCTRYEIILGISL